MYDVVIVGGGVIGLSLAWELAGDGLQVTVLDQSQLGMEASWAGAGMIPPGDLNHPATHQLAVLSAQRWPYITAALRSETGLDNGYRRCGAWLLGSDGEQDRLLEAWRTLGLTVEKISGNSLRERAPAFSPQIESAVWLPDLAQVRNPWHLRALQAACTQRGVTLQPDQKVIRWVTDKDRVQTALTDKGEIHAGQFVVASGAWSPQLLESLGISLPIEPVHGQVVLLKGDQPPIRSVVEQGIEYLVPRSDGRVLVGATEERIGFKKRTTPEAIDRLLTFARSIVPGLEELPVEKTWSGLRPWSGLGHPSLGRAPGFENLFVAAGHFRAGLSNSPGTALVLRQLILDEPPTIDLSGLGFESSSAGAAESS